MRVRKTLIIKLDQVYENLNINDDDFIIKLKSVFYDITQLLYDKYRYIEILYNGICFISFDKNNIIINTMLDNAKDDILSDYNCNLIKNFIETI